MSDESRGGDEAACPHGNRGGGPCSCFSAEKVYWCDICKATFSEKRCPQCGLKLKRLI